MSSVDSHFRKREQMKDLLVELSKRKPGGKALRDMLTRMLNAHTAVGIQIAKHTESVRGTCPCCVYSALWLGLPKQIELMSAAILDTTSPS